MHKFTKNSYFLNKNSPKKLKIRKKLCPHSTKAYIMGDPKEDPDPDLDPK